MMTYKSIKRASMAAAAALVCAGAAQAKTVGMLIGYESTDHSNAQESVAAKWFEATYPGGVIITPSTLDKIDAQNLEAIWVHIDRVGCGRGHENLPAEFNNDDVMDALAEYLEDGGNLYLSKFATQLVAPLGRIPASQQVNIFGDGDGGDGFDDWCINAYLGSWQVNPDNQEQDPTQIYDRTGHAIYAGLQTFTAAESGFVHPAIPMEGTGDIATSVWREDHNCCWDLNGFEINADGKNTLEKFENQNNCTVVGTWGHVQDYCVAGIVEFEPKGALKGRIIANGLATCEWAPRSGVNVYHDNLEKLTKNAIDYLAPNQSSVKGIEAAGVSAPVYYNIQGMKVANPTEGLYIKVEGGRAVKVVL